MSILKMSKSGTRSLLMAGGLAAGLLACAPVSFAAEAVIETSLKSATGQKSITSQKISPEPQTAVSTSRKKQLQPAKASSPANMAQDKKASDKTDGADGAAAKKESVAAGEKTAPANPADPTAALLAAAKKLTVQADQATSKDADKKAKQEANAAASKKKKRKRVDRRPAPKNRKKYARSGICRDLDKLARRYKLPPLFFARLIWQESGFNPYALSPVGAEGIAQFMPATAAVWGLEDPFEPGQALIKSAQYLSWLKRKLGNLGLAAAGYNAGSQRVKTWLAGTGYMPLETRNYVYAITGHTVEEWAQGNIRFVGLKARGRMSSTACKQLSMALKNERVRFVRVSLPRATIKGKKGKNKILPYNRKNMRKAVKNGHSRGAYRRGRRLRLPRVRRLPRMPWGVQLAGSFSRQMAMKQFHVLKRKYGRIIGNKRIVLKSSRQQGRGRRIFHRVRVGTKTRTAAAAICKKLRTVGGNCVVLKN